MTTTERGWATLPSWSTAHLMAPAGEGHWKAECGRVISIEPAPAAEGVPHCGHCQNPGGAKWQRPKIVPRQQPSRVHW